MQYFKGDIEITKEQAYSFIRETAKSIYKADYTDEHIDAMFSNPLYNSFTCIDSMNEKVMISSKNEGYIIELPSETRQMRLF